MKSPGRLLDPHPDSFQIRGLHPADREIRRLRNIMLLNDSPMARADRRRNSSEKILGAPRCSVAGGKQHPSSPKYSKSGQDQFDIMFFRLKHAALLGARERRRVKDDRVEEALLTGQTPEPLKHVAMQKVVARRVDLVEGKIALAPLKIFFG